MDEGRKWPYPLLKDDVITAVAKGEIHLMKDDHYFQHVDEEELSDTEKQRGD